MRMAGSRQKTSLKENDGDHHGHQQAGELEQAKQEFAGSNKNDLHWLCGQGWGSAKHV